MKRNGIMAGAVGGAVATLGLSPWVVDAVSALLGARQTRINLATSATMPAPTPPPIVAPGLKVTGGSASAAASGLQARVRRLAAKGGVLVENARATAAGPGLAGLSLRISGPAKAVVALADTVERDAPLARFDDWRVTALPGGGLRLEGRLVAAWR